MMRMFASVGAAALTTLAMAGSSFAQGTTGKAGEQGTMKMTEAQCESAWNTADSGGSGSLSQSAAQAHVTNFASVDSDKSGSISRAEFLAGCQKGLVRSSAGTGGATGAGSGGGTQGTVKK